MERPWWARIFKWAVTVPAAPPRRAPSISLSKKTPKNLTNYMSQKSEPENRKYRIFIVDDHPLVREGLSNLINQQEDFAVCGEAEDAAQALAGIGVSKP